MKPQTQPADIVDAYVQWATSSIDAWATSATAMADKVQSGSFTAADWVAEAGLWAGRCLQATYDLYDALVNGPPAAPVVSEDFSTAPPVKGFVGARDLRLAGSLHAMMTQTLVPPAAVRIVPPSLQGADTTFHLEVDPTNLPGDAYWGSVEVVQGGAVQETVDVVVQVP